MSSPRTGPGRRAGTSTTRAEILAAARTHFAEDGYDGTSLRAIGATAGVDAALISYFFGSKQDLFLAALELPFDPAEVLPGILAGDPDLVGHRLATLMATVLGSDELRPRILGLIRSAARENAAAELIRQRLVRELLVPLAEHLGSEDAELRASLAMSQVAGIALARHVIGLPALAAADPDELVRLVGPTLQRYLAGSLSHT